jgi:hypothetical protein
MKKPSGADCLLRGISTRVRVTFPRNRSSRDATGYFWETARVVMAATRVIPSAMAAARKVNW